MRRLSVFLTTHCWAVVLVATLITIGLGIGATKLSVVIDPDATLPQTHHYLIATNEADRLFGNKNPIVIGIIAKSGNALEPEVLNALVGITTKISLAQGVVRQNVLSLAARKVKDIRGTDDGLTVKPLLAHATASPMEIKALREAIQRNPAYQDLLLSRDGSTVSVIAQFKKDPGGYKAIIQRVEDVVAPYRSAEVQIAVGGQPRFLGLTESYSDRMIMLFPLAVLLIGLVHWEAFRSFQGLILPLATGLLAVVWSVGIIGWSGVTLDAFTSTTPILILAVAAGHAVQILKRYYEEFHHARGRGQDPNTANKTAVIASLIATGPVMLTAGCIAAASFASLTVFGISSIRTFGLFTALGIVSAILIELTLIPALRTILPPLKGDAPRSEQEGGFWAALASKIAGLTLRRNGTVLLISGLFLAGALISASHIRIENSLRSFFIPSVQARIDDATLNTKLPGVNLLYVMVKGPTADAIKRPDILKAMQETQAFLDREPHIGKTVSLADYIRRIDGAMKGDHGPGIIPENRDLISQYLLLYSMSGEPTDFDSFVDDSYRNAIIVAYLNEESSIYLSNLDGRLQSFMKAHFPPDVETSIGGNVMSPVALNEVLVKDKLINMLQIAGVVFLISSICFRSATVGALALVPLVLTVAALFGLMGLFGIPLQVATVTVAAAGVGIGADYAIYMSFRLREELRRSQDIELAVRRTFEAAGKAVMFVATAVAVGYATIMLSWGFLIHFWLGLLFSVAMLVSSVATLTTFMALMVRVRPSVIFQQSAKRRVHLVVLPLLALMIAGLDQANAAELTGDQIMDQNFAIAKVKDSVAGGSFTLISAGGEERVRATITKTKLEDNGVDTMRLTRFTAPEDVRGTSTLTIEHANADDDIWVYLPALKKTRRLVASNKHDSYVGTDFSYGDIIGYRTSDWKNELLRTEPCDSVQCFVIQSTPKTADVADSSGYSKRISWIRKDNLMQVKGELYDRGGQLQKLLTLADIQQVGSAPARWQAMHLEMKDVQSSHRTVILLKDFKANQGVSNDVFQPRTLERQ